MLARRGVQLFLVAALLGPGGCAEDDTLNGVWTGAVRDNLGGFGGGDITFTQSGTTLEGSWQFVFQTFQPTPQYNNDGTLAGTVEGTSISAVLTPSKSTCSFALQATRSGNVIKGNYSAINCAVVQTGAVDLEKMP